jgi:predicted unusual protein kinase regulating ubiquinone biosynthesis (AarF/ABC1/UbiB family)
LEDFLIATKKQHRSVAKFLLPTYYIATIQCLGILEGLAIEVDPKARVISAAYPYVASRVSMGPYVAEKKSTFSKVSGMIF